LRLVQRTAAYALIRDPGGRVLLVRASPRSDLAGHWFLPGGGLQHGESPIDAVRREVREETGLRIQATAVRPLAATGDVIDLPHRGACLHTVRLIFEADFPGEEHLAALRAEADGTSDLVRFVSLDAAAGLPLVPFAASVLGLPQRPVTVSVPIRPEPLAGQDAGGATADGLNAEDLNPELLDPGEPDNPDAGAGSDGPDEADSPAEPGPHDEGVLPVLVQRPAAYAVLVSGNLYGSGQILLSKLTGSDVWTLPGGGIDHGESPLEALEREVYEEAGLPYTAGPLLDISSRHFTGRAPTGRLEDFHGIRLLYGGSVPTRPDPHVVDVGGSSDDAAWFALRDLGRIRTVASVRHGLRALRRIRPA
jgi:8-oxo-dGTP pyrophosphatase MutT (NUDIX family)